MFLELKNVGLFFIFEVYDVTIIFCLLECSERRDFSDNRSGAFYIANAKQNSMFFVGRWNARTTIIIKQYEI